MAKAAKAKTPIKGGRLNKKVGPLPLKYWIPIAAGVLLILWLYFRNKGGNTVEGEGETALLPYSAVVTPQQAASAGTPSPNSSVSGQLSPEVLAALGIVSPPTDYVTGTDLQSQLDSLGSNVASQIASATFVSNTKETVTSEVAKTPVAVKTATAAPVKKIPVTVAKTPVRYYTFAPGKAPKGRKADEIPVRTGAQLKFKKGSGYYYG